MKTHFFLFAVATLLITGCGQKDPQRGDTFQVGGAVGERAPSVSLEDLDGGRVALDSLHGDIVVLSVWSEICGECLGVEGDLQEMEELNLRYNQNVQGVSVFAPNFIDPVWRIRELQEQGGYHIAILHDPDRTFAEAFEISELPVMLVFVIDRSGIIHYRENGVDTQEIEQVIAGIP